MTAACDPSICETEPIATPGAIQPHGALVTAQADSGLVAHASANLAEILGLPAAAALGRPICDVIGHVNEVLLREARRRGSETLESIGSLRRADGRLLHLHAFQSGDYMCLDLEAVRDEDDRLPPGLTQSVIETFSAAVTQVELCELAVHGLRQVTGYDRVMAYRFGPDGHGEVIAEDLRPDLEPYLGLRYPASDIPQIARALYLRQRVGSIADSHYKPVPLLGHPGIDALDLTHSALRSVSPIHLEYMRNMHTAASLTIGLADGDRLWGMLVCHNMTPRTAGPERRAAAGMIGQVVSLLLSRLGEVENAAEKLARQATLSTLVDRLSIGDTLAAAITAADPLLLDLVGASGAVVRLEGQELHFGRIPPADAVRRALEILGSTRPPEILAIDDVTLRHPELPELAAAGSGLLLLPLPSGDGDLIAWFRPEHVQTITWGGNPAEHGTWNPQTRRMSPRASFDAWKETVTGRSLPWTSIELACAHDLGEAITAEMAQRTRAALARLRHYDPLTGLANRSFLQECLANATLAGGPDVALLFIDLDRFKAVNDSMGHGVGDGLLIEVAHSLVASVRPEDLVVRLGGDEFVVLCHGLDRAAVMGLAERLRQVLERPFEVTGRKCHISASIGIAMSDSIGELDLVRAADIAMYAAKKNGGNRGELFRPSLYEETTQLVELDNDLRNALENGQFHLAYQPIFALAPGTERLVGFEALLRWEHPHYGSLQPGVFIPMAEKLGHIHVLGDWALRNALRQVQAFRSAGPELDLKINVNVSPLQLAKPGFAARLTDMLGQMPDLPSHALCLEITETCLSDEAVSEALGAIRALGVQVAIDDFGTGFSSLACLRRLPADIVKLDRAFLKNSSAEPQDDRFFAAVNSLIHAVDLKVVQEGVETPAQIDFIRATGADFAQGFHLARPLSIPAALDLISASRQDRPRPPDRT
ncbi:EAL domain-containing protein (plasmid) [Cereibacter azotoformans]|uniref:Diguanylate cyclase/phosphodiesterase with phytochrome (GAF) sensor n=1 Tax=Cereibacter azotoformans TaxID=43057 RepID=A0A2T5JUL3_9RHOB|nr:EAL domain-containing protein [Cereibacter azotoformans]AXQ96218.1 EAL domain-containing protein [Cereibacter sphaeroides]PTR13842.1 diguanylate cyclase/phosphodiesterase with phytochrome (GAF) sensor [Cereibacter azotoformans]UIJ33226.1 EAL domain-containing protein [Cereibacter azotoformans]